MILHYRLKCLCTLGGGGGHKLNTDFNKKSLKGHRHDFSGKKDD